MRILISTVAFPPSIGGMETAAVVLANGLAARGHDVTVVTPMTTTERDVYPFTVVRSPDMATLWRLTRACDVLWQNHISLRLVWPAWLLRKPIVFMHHIWLESHSEAKTRFGGIKRLACMTGANAFVSRALRDTARLDGPIIPNSYDEDIFRLRPEIPRDRDVAFLGRLTRSKGADLMIDALALLARQGLHLSGTVIGTGLQEPDLKAQAASRGLADAIAFPGPLRGEDLARMLNRHRVLVVPSRWDEAFGIVVLEALASGCVVAVANSGGLPEALGPCGPTFARDNPQALADVIGSLLDGSGRLENYRLQAPAHLKAFSRAAQLDACEDLIHAARRG